MRRLRCAALAAIAVFGFAPVVSAADLPTKAPIYKAPAAVVAYDWTGCYVGGNAGWIGGRDQLSLSPSGDLLSSNSIFGDPANRAPLLNSYEPHGSGLTAGIQAGCNRQFGKWVLGVEADSNWSSLNENADVSYAPFVLPNDPTSTVASHTEQVTKTLDWFSTVRARVGYAFDRLLIFGTGGLAIGHIKSSTDVLFAGGPGFIFNFNHTVGSDDRIRLGLAVGGGFEYALANNWSVKGEYLYLDFGSYSYESPIIDEPGFSWSTTVRAREHVARVGLNYKFY